MGWKYFHYRTKCFEKINYNMVLYFLIDKFIPNLINQSNHLEVNTNHNLSDLILRAILSHSYLSHNQNLSQFILNLVSVITAPMSCFTKIQASKLIRFMLLVILHWYTLFHSMFHCMHLFLLVSLSVVSHILQLIFLYFL